MEKSRRKEITELAKEIFAAGYFRNDSNEDHRKKATKTLVAATIFYDVADELLKPKSFFKRIL